jgi:hypothetical protein
MSHEKAHLIADGDCAMRGRRATPCHFDGLDLRRTPAELAACSSF